MNIHFTISATGHVLSQTIYVLTSSMCDMSMFAACNNTITLLDSIVLYYAILWSDLEYIHITIHVPRHALNSMNFFSLFIEVPRTVLFRATAIH